MEEADAAVVISNSAYESLPPLDYARPSADHVADWLIRKRKIPVERVHVIRDGTRQDISAALRAAAGEVGAGGTLWVYFAGRATSDGSLLAIDAPPEPPRVGDRSIHVAEIPPPGPLDFRLQLIIDGCTDDVFTPGEAPGTERLVPRGELWTWASFAHGACTGPAPDGTGAFTKAVLAKLGRRGEVEGSAPEPRTGMAVRPAGQATAFFLVDPPGTTISLDGQPLCISPCATWIATGTHRVGLSDGRGSAERDIVAQDIVVVREPHDFKHHRVDAVPEHALRVEAITALQRVLVDPQYPFQVSEGELRTAYLMLDEWRAHRGTPTGDEWLAEARAALDRGARAQPTSAFTFQAAVEPGFLLWEDGQRADAVAAWTAIATSSVRAGPWAEVLLADIAFTGDDFATARKHLERVASTKGVLAAYATEVLRIDAEGGSADPFADALGLSETWCRHQFSYRDCGQSLAWLSDDLARLRAP